MKIRPGRAPGAAGPGAPRRAALQEGRSSLLMAAEGRTRRPWGAIGPETLRKHKSAKRPTRGLQFGGARSWAPIRLASIHQRPPAA
jgi:hypothetical protein